MAKCRRPECGKSAALHMLVGQRLACAWEGRKITIEADFGPDVALVVEDMYLMTGRKVPQQVALNAQRRRKEQNG